jgi:general secretion pathway protein C
VFFCAEFDLLAGEQVSVDIAHIHSFWMGIISYNMPMMNMIIDIRGLLLAIVAFFLIGYSLWRWHGDWVIAHQPLTAKPTLNATDETATMIAGIPDDHLFGNTYSKNGDVPISDLQLRVTGIVKVENETSTSVSKAYISISGQPSKIYQVGDSLPYGVKVHEITADAVILENGSRLEKLPLPREKLEFKPRPAEEGV